MFPDFDNEMPAEAKRLVAAGAALPPPTSECLLPAEVSRAVPQGVVMMIGYGPEAYFADKPNAPTWTTRVSLKTTAMVIRGMGAMGEDAGSADQPQQPQQQPKKKCGFGLGGILGSIPHP